MILRELTLGKRLWEMGGFSSNPYYEFRLVARYLIQQQEMIITKELLYDHLVGLLLREGMDVIEYEKALMEIASTEVTHPTKIIDIDKVYVTEQEVEEVRKLSLVSHRKLLFTHIIYARVLGLKRGVYDNVWTNGYQKEEMYKSSNLSGAISDEDYFLIIHQLKKAGVISLATRVDNINFKVECMHDEGEIAFWVEDLETLGNTIEDYINLTYNGYKRCECCGKSYKPKSNNSKYCGKNCQTKIKTQQQAESRRQGV